MGAPVLAVEAQAATLPPPQQLMHGALQINQGLISLQAPFACPFLHGQVKHLQTSAAVAAHRRLGALKMGGSALTGAQPQQGIQCRQHLH
jgi:hypothetical protein